MHPAVKVYVQARLKGRGPESASADALFSYDWTHFNHMLDTPGPCGDEWLELKLARLVQLGLPEDAI